MTSDPTMLNVRLRQIRIEKEWSQGRLALYSKVSKTTIQRFEVGKTDVSSAILNRICTALGVEIKLTGRSIEGHDRATIQTVDTASDRVGYVNTQSSIYNSPYIGNQRQY